MRIVRAHHVAVICSDYGRSKDFYARVLGLEVVAEVYRAERDSHKLDFRLTDGVRIELFSSRPRRRATRRRAGCGTWRSRSRTSGRRSGTSKVWGWRSSRSGWTATPAGGSRSSPTRTGGPRTVRAVTRTGRSRERVRLQPTQLRVDLGALVVGDPPADLPGLARRPSHPLYDGGVR